MKKLEHWKIVSIFLAVFDVGAAMVSYFAALWLRFDGSFTAIPVDYMHACVRFMPGFALMTVAVLYVFGLYNRIWRFLGIEELGSILKAWAVLTLAQIVGITVFFLRMPISYYLIGAALQLMFIGGIRYSYRIYLKLMEFRRLGDKSRTWKRTMIIGAGQAGQQILRDIRNNDSDNFRVVCFVDDNSNKWGREVLGVPVVGGRDDILANVKKYNVEQILLAIPSASAKDKRDILSVCNETDCETKTLPGLYQFVNDQVSLAKMKDVAIEDLLGRDPIRVDMTDVYEFVKGKTILVTGGGGSIGSELCRQIASHSPKQLIIFDVYENNAYEIEQELKAKHPELNLAVLIGSVRDSRRLQWVFEHYRPDVVYHAAAHKHVPLMETSPNEAIKNNSIGTYKTAYAALMHGCERFVLISTDKAVNPTNIMGASKRLCEMVIQSLDAVSKSGIADKLPLISVHDETRHSRLTDLSCGVEQTGSRERKFRTEFVAVRFGNVLGSNGSVIPLFKKQIERGGPVTVTHPDIIRYFMTISEAVSLVLKAGVRARGGEIFVLDMGEPVKIDTLARNLIKLSGYKPGEDIEIVYTGLRPGEKLYEEKLMAEEGLRKTENDLIHVAKPILFDTDRFLQQLFDLAEASYSNSEDIVDKVAAVVSTFHPVGAHPEANIQKEPITE